MSAFRARKPTAAWSQLLDDLRGGQLDALVSYPTDRFYRRPVDLERLITIVEELPHGVQVATVESGEYDPDHPGRPGEGGRGQTDHAPARGRQRPTSGATRQGNGRTARRLRRGRRAPFRAAGALREQWAALHSIRRAPSHGPYWNGSSSIRRLDEGGSRPDAARVRLAGLRPQNSAG